MWPFNKKEKPDRREIREEFYFGVNKLKTWDEQSQIAVGHVINLASAKFFEDFISTDIFICQPEHVRTAYIDDLMLMEKEQAEAKNSHASIGLGLFHMYIQAISADDKELISGFFKELAFFCKKADQVSR